MNKRKLASALLAGALLFTSAIPASAAKATGTPTPHQVFYREEAGQTFSGKIHMEKGVTEVEAGQPAFSLSVQDGAVLFDSLYTSTRQSIRATCDGESVSQEVNLAVYDTLDIAPATGSAILTVKDARTLKPIPGAKYALYTGTSLMKSGLESDDRGRVAIDVLAPGSYELRQTAVPKGYQPSKASVKFTVTGLSVSGGDTEIHTSGGRKITVGGNEVLIAGPFSPDITLTAENEKQIEGVTVTYENFGAFLGKPGTEKSFDYVTLRAAQEEINHLKDEEEICGAVHIAYTLKEPACNLTQYLAEKPAPKPTPTPPAPSQGGASGSAGTTAAPAATPAPTPAATQAPPSVNPIATPAPTVEPSAEPEEIKAEKRGLNITVLDTDGKPVPGVTVGLFEPTEDIPAPTNTADPADISQSVFNLQNQRETEKISQDPYKRSAALQAARTDEQGRASFPKAPATELVAVPVKVPDGYSTEKIPTEIPAGMEEDFTVTCPYIAVDLSVYSNATDSPVAGADAVLCNEDGDELASWVTAESPRRFIRVPKGEYTLRIKSKDGEDKISFSVGGDTPLQKVRAETYLPGIREESGTKLDFTGTLPLLPYVGGAALILAGAAAGIAAFLRKRKRGRGLK